MGPEREKKGCISSVSFSGACSGHSEIRGDESQKSKRKKEVVERNKRGNFCWYIICPGGQETQRL